ncbi:MAG: hypothetical protein NTX01_01115 [Candidatus Omnitrophica bacterium]|nr:hypothetical protein [Candidatus Omnitrophota bacterium]
MLRRSRKGQSTAEYAIVIGLVIAAVIGMQVYVKRGIQGKIADASDTGVTDADIPDIVHSDTNYGVNDQKQFEPRYSTSTKMVSTRDATENVTVSRGGGIVRDIVGSDNSSRTGQQEILAP